MSVARTFMRSARSAAARPSPFTASFARQAQFARPAAARFYATEGEAKAEETKTEENGEADKIKKELEAKQKEVVELKV